MLIFFSSHGREHASSAIWSSTPCDLHPRRVRWLGENEPSVKKSYRKMVPRVCFFFVERVGVPIYCGCWAGEHLPGALDLLGFSFPTSPPSRIWSYLCSPSSDSTVGDSARGMTAPRMILPQRCSMLAPMRRGGLWRQACAHTSSPVPWCVHPAAGCLRDVSWARASDACLHADAKEVERKGKRRKEEKRMSLVSLKVFEQLFTWRLCFMRFGWAAWRLAVWVLPAEELHLEHTAKMVCLGKRESASWVVPGRK
ncbi:hypothetical protein EJB05_46451, partial [Eragrostis curvula]